MDIFRSVLGIVSTEYDFLVNTRNTLLHGTWFIGYSTEEDSNAENFVLESYKTTKKGLERYDVPKHAHELLRLKDRCEDARNWISFIHWCVPRDDRPYDRIAERFLFADGSWRLKINADTALETLPRVIFQ